MVNQETGEILGVPGKAPVFLRTAYNYDMDAVSRETGWSTMEPSLAKQEFKDETNINTIVERFGLTGELPSDVKMPMSGDFTDAVTDYQSALNMVLKADEEFLRLPAHVRAEFDNNPQKLLEFVENPKNRDKAKELGLLVPDVVKPAPMEVMVMNSPPAAKDQ